MQRERTRRPSRHQPRDASRSHSPPPVRDEILAGRFFGQPVIPRAAERAAGFLYRQRAPALAEWFGAATALRLGTDLMACASGARPRHRRHRCADRRAARRHPAPPALAPLRRALARSGVAGRRSRPDRPG